MDKMNASHPHFICCIKPNPLKQPLNYGTAYVLTQLRYAGVMETTRIRRCVYPTRINFDDFVKRYKLVLLNFNLFYIEQNTFSMCNNV